MIPITDPKGVVHSLGRIEEDNDYSTCGEIFTTVGGWNSRKGRAICVRCISMERNTNVISGNRIVQ